MRIVCVATEGGSPLFSSALGHGEDPYLTVWQHGLTLTRTLSAENTSNEIVLTVQGAPTLHRPVQRRRRRHRPKGPERPTRRQRVAAYGIVLSERGILGTEFSNLTNASGSFGLPGGGIEPGEQPPHTVVREVYEETSQHVTIGPLVDVQSDHWIGHAPNGRFEDFHAVRLVYTVFCDDPTDPVVIDVGGTTASARWVPLDNWRDTPWVSGSRALLAKHLPEARRLWALHRAEHD